MLLSYLEDDKVTRMVKARSLPSSCSGVLEKTRRRRIALYSQGYLAAFVVSRAARLTRAPPAVPRVFLDQLVRDRIVGAMGWLSQAEAL